MAATNVWCLVIDYEKRPVGSSFEVSGPDTLKVAGLKENVKEKKSIDLKDVDPDRLVVWRCKDRSNVLNRKNLNDWAKRIFLSDGAEELEDRATIVGLRLEPEETLIVQVPDNRGTKYKHWQEALHKEIYEKGWGRAWPQHKGVITEVDCGFGDAARMQVGDEPNLGTTGVPSSWQYTCIDDIRDLGSTLRMLTNVPPNLIIRDEYEYMRLALEHMVELAGHSLPLVLTGQPGIGKTVFLLYLLLYRMERRLPTAIQLGSQEYIVFDKRGVGVFGVYDTSETLSSDCWALCDSNNVVLNPCEAFQSSSAVIVQATSARQDRWKEWSKQRHARLIVMDLPRPFEIAAIAREARFEPAKAITVMQKWGPATRTVMYILQELRELQERRERREPDPSESPCERQYKSARTAAAAVAEDPSIVMSAHIDKLTSFASILLFLRPVRNGNLDVNRSHVLEIPTPTLAEIFDDARARFSNMQLLQLFESLSSHSLTRAGAGWAHEKTMHVFMSQGGEPLDLLPHGKFQPAKRLLPGTVAALGFEEYDSFYWLPSVANFEGIDGVLGNKGDIYALQATIASTHTSATIDEGLRKVWAAIHPSARKKRWHFVVYTDTEPLAQRYLHELARGPGFALGVNQVPVNVCACVSPKLII